MNAVVFTFDDALNGFNGFIEAVFGVDDHVVKFFDARQFFAGHGDPHVEVFVGFGLAGAEAADEFGFVTGGEEDEDRFGAQAADGGRTLHIEAHDHIFAAREGLAHLGFGDAFVVVVDVGIFEQFVLLDHFGKFGLGDEEVVYPVDFTGADAPGGGGDNEVKREATSLHGFEDGVFANPGRAGDDDEEGFGSGRGEGEHGEWGIME